MYIGEDEWVLYTKRFVGIIGLPIIVNIVFGQPFLIKIGLQRALTIIIICLYFLYLLLLLLYLLGFFNRGRIGGFIDEWLPSIVRAKLFLKKNTQKNSGLEPSTSEEVRGPVRWMLFHRLPCYLVVLF